MYKEQGLIDNFEQLLDNIFHPLFEVTRDPNSHPQLHLFLKTVGCWAAYVPLLHLHLDFMPEQWLIGVIESTSQARCLSFVMVGLQLCMPCCCGCLQPPELGIMH